MSLYITVGVLLFLGALFELLRKKTSPIIYTVMFIGLLAMLCFRYGQGTDYFSYQYIFEYTPKTLNIFELLTTSSSVHSEVGWKFLCALFKLLGINYYVFVAVIGTVTMFLLNIFIKKFCPLKTTALFIAYPTLYLTYISSGMRQGLVICFFLSVLLELYLKKKYMKFLVLVLLCSLIHTASLILLILLIVPLKNALTEYQDIIIVLCWLLGIGFSFFGFSITFLGRTFANEVTSISYIAVAERILTYAMIRVIYSGYKRLNVKQCEFLDAIMYVYSLCMVLYGLLFSMPTLASRICYFFKSTEILLITTMLADSKRKFINSYYLFMYIAALTMVMLFKNIDSYIGQGTYYYEFSNIWSFPYNNIFIKGNYRYSIHQNLLP